MSKFVHVGNAMFVDTEPVDPPEDVEVNPNVRIYAYARFRSLEHVSFGLTRTEGGPEDEEIDSEGVGQYGMEPIATRWEFGDALKEIEAEAERGNDPTLLFEEEPFVEVTSKKQYDEALVAIDTPASESAWEKPGVYDFRDDPPTFVSTVEQYEEDSMIDAADQAVDSMFQSDEWQDAYRSLAEEEA